LKQNIHVQDASETETFDTTATLRATTRAQNQAGLVKCGKREEQCKKGEKLLGLERQQKRALRLDESLKGCRSG